MIVLFFDTETTGFPNRENPPHIVQIGAILQDTESGRVLGELNAIVQSPVPIPEVCVKVHGITDELSAKYGLKPDVADHMFALMAAKADRLVAHNIAFDTSIIQGVWKVSRAVIDDKEKYCTMLNCTSVVGLSGSHAGGKKWPKMTEAYAHFNNGETFDGAHDAMADVRACQFVYHKLQETTNV